MATPAKDGMRIPDCAKCRRPMRLIGGMPGTTNLPRLDSYRCEVCNDVCVLEERGADK